MKILYYTWSELSAPDVIDGLEKLGNEVVVNRTPFRDYCVDEQFYTTLKDAYKEHQCDCIFTMDYFPLISKLSFNCKIPYIVWVYDKPHLTMYSQMIHNPYQFVFTFDRKMRDEFMEYGVKNIFHMPLATNVKRLDRQLTVEPVAGKDRYDSEVSFVGTLQSAEYGAFDSIENMPEYLRGFYEGICDAQMQLYGYNLIEEQLTQKLSDELEQYAAIQLPEEFFVSKRKIFADMLNKKVTGKERNELLREVAQHYSLTLCAGKRPEWEEASMMLDYRGYVDYIQEMPVVFHRSKINLNITMRTIDSGIPQRVFDILGAGGFLLTNYQPEIAEFFEDGVELVMYTGKQDLLKKIQYYLMHEEEREKIAQAGYNKVRQQYTYEKQLAKMFEIVQMQNK